MNRFESARLSFTWWSLFLLLAPFFWWQGRQTRARTPRLPEASGECSGFIPGDGLTRCLVAIGESPVAGVGVDCYENSLTAELARVFAARTGHPVKWHAIGENGINLRDTRTRLVPRLAGLQPDLVIVALGVNDSTGLTSRHRWRGELLALLMDLQDRTTAPVLFAAVPPLGSFSALPQPLRFWLGLRARLLDADLRRALHDRTGVLLSPPLPPLVSEQLASDGYHPSAVGCKVWAAQLHAVLDEQGYPKPATIRRR